LEQVISMSFVCDLSGAEYVRAANLHRDSTDEFMKKAIALLEKNPHEITTGCSEFGSLVKKRAKAVLREIHLLSAYTRLKPYPELLLVGRCRTDHNTGFSIAKSLSRRFKGFIILLLTPENHFLATVRKDIPAFPEFEGESEEIIETIRDFITKFCNVRLSNDILLEEGDFLWEKYYETQFLEQRLNTRLFRKFIPKYVTENANMKIEKEFYKKAMEKRNEKKTLDDFFKKNNKKINSDIKKSSKIRNLLSN